MADISNFGRSCIEWDTHLRYAPTTTTCRPQDAEDLQRSTNRAREALSAHVCAKLGLDRLVHQEDYSVVSADGGSFPVRVYRPRLSSRPMMPGYLYFHGGGFLFGSLDSEQADCAQLALKAQIVVIHACYRHTPQHVFPTAHEDAWAALQWVLARQTALQYRSLVVGGVSAGGNLAASVTLRHNQQQLAEPRHAAAQKNRGSIDGLLLCTPWLVHPDAYPYHLLASREGASPVGCASAPLLPKHRLDLFTQLLKVSDPADQPFNMGNAAEGLVGMPKTAVLVAGRDPFRDEALLYAQRLRQSRVLTKTHIFPGLPHGFRKFNELPSARRWDDLILECFEWFLATQEPRTKMEAGSDWIVVENTSSTPGT